MISQSQIPDPRFDESIRVDSGRFGSIRVDSGRFGPRGSSSESGGTLALSKLRRLSLVIWNRFGTARSEAIHIAISSSIDHLEPMSFLCPMSNRQS